MKLGTKLIRSVVKSQHSGDLADKLGEVALDALLTPSLLRDIPVIGTAISLAKAGNDIAAYFFAKKIALFLNEIESVSREERQAFFDQQCSDDNNEKLGETTLLLLDKIDAMILAQCIGRAFSLLMAGEISRGAFDLFAYTIKDLNPYLIQQLKQVYSVENVMIVDSAAAVQLSNYGLMDVTTKSTTTNPGTLDKGYEKTAHGQKFYDLILAPSMCG